MSNDQIAWSWSRLNRYRKCQLQSFWMDYAPKAEKVIEPPNPVFEKGKKMHKSMEDALNRGTPLPAGMPVPGGQVVDLSHLEGVVSSLRNAERLWVENQLAFDKNLRPTSWFGKDAWCRVIWDAAAKRGPKVNMCDWKGLALDTKIPTPSGWTTMKDIKEGDQVFDARGKVCNVVGKSDVRKRPCFKLTFADTTTVVCDDEHLWVVGDKEGRVVDTKTLFEEFKEGAREIVRLARPLDTPDVDLPLHPYVLGIWLGDGKHTSGEITNPEDFIWEKIKSCGYELGENYGRNTDRCRVHTVRGIRTALKELGVLGNKHVPAMYLRAGYEQRMQLLHGLMDSDGSANTVRKQAIFTSCSKRLSDDTMELLCSLGQRPLQSTTTQRGFGLTVTAYPISFRPQGINPFTLPRKADRMDAKWGPGLSWNRKFKSIEPVSTVPTQCIAVDSADSTYLCTERMLPTHNSGKPKADVEQLELFAASVFTAVPDIEEVHTHLVFLEHRKFTHDVFYRSAADHIWQKFGEEAEQIQIAQETGNWEPDPGDFKCRYCPVPKSKCQYSQVEG